MAREHAPAFQFYPKDFLTDGNVAVMSLQERGAYITLLCNCWIEGSIPIEPAKLARSCGVSVPVFQRLWPALAPCFRTNGNADRLIQPRLERERNKQEAFRHSQREKGASGAAARWGKR